MVKVCQIEGCDSPLIARGWCGMHYRRWRLAGDPGPAEPSRHRNGSPLEERFWSFVVKAGPDDCWIWTGTLHPFGYGYFKAGDKQLKAHRVAYELVVGPIPDGLEIDHMCHNRDLSCPGGATCRHRRCVNPAHLEPLTHRENSLRGRSFAVTNAEKTHCVHGHPFDEKNTYVRSNGHRGCRACNDVAQRAYQARKKALI